MVLTAVRLEELLPATFTADELSEKEFLAICETFPDAMVEYFAPEGTILVMPPTDPRTGVQNARIIQQLFNWCDLSGRGMVTGSSAGFFLPNGSRRSPDASWFDKARWEAAERPGLRFPTFTPEFVIELRSPSDRLPALQAKMREYIENGVELGWLIDPQQRTVSIYRPNQPPETLLNPSSVEGEGPVQGFVLDLRPVFEE